MKTLILHQHFKTPGTGGAIRSYYLAKALADNGFEVVVITAHNQLNHLVADLEGIKVHYLPIPYDNRFGFYQRIWSFLKFTWNAVNVAGKYRDADLCYAISTPLTTGMAAQIIRWRYGVPYVFEVGDLWPDAPIGLGLLKNKILTSLSYWIEKEIYSKALSIVALSAPIRDAIAAKVRGKTIDVIPNMADTEFYIPGEKSKKLEERFDVRGKFVISYIGALGMANGLHHFIGCADAARKENLPLHFVLAGDGAMADELRKRVRELELSNLTIHPFLNRDGVRDLLNVTDACFVSFLPAKILETGSPNKYFDALAAGKLVITNFKGWVKDEVEHEECGVYVDALDSSTFPKVIRPFVEDRQRWKAYSENARRLAERKYSRRQLGLRFCDVLSNSSGQVASRLSYV